MFTSTLRWNSLEFAAQPKVTAVDISKLLRSRVPILYVPLKLVLKLDRTNDDVKL